MSIPVLKDMSTHIDDSDFYVDNENYEFLCKMEDGDWFVSEIYKTDDATVVFSNIETNSDIDIKVLKHFYQIKEINET